MKRVLDTSVWFEWFTGGELADQVRPFLEDEDSIVMPTMVLMETYKWLYREVGEAEADAGVARQLLSDVLDMDRTVATFAARLSKDAGLATADAVILAHARLGEHELVTLDHHFEGIAGVTYLPKGRRR